MQTTLSKKNIILATILTTGLSLAISQAAIAKPGDGYNRGMAPCQIQQMNPVVQKAKQKFMDETVEVRKQLAEKRAAMRAVMRADQPDPAQASKIAGELFDLREQLRTKAQEYGLPMGMMMGPHGYSGDRDGKRGGGMARNNN